ncbi:MAG: hypothetical protein HYU66_10550, partial [Armatimonadetes bacterium]|nr:hypothetical protein [Armatimonadota bacterium]
WDVFEFAHALRHFDPSWSQPHVPGFPLFILAGKLIHLLVRDELLALRWVSALASALSVPLLYRLGRRVGERERAALWAAWWCTVPLFWRFGVLPLSYTLEALVAVGLAAMWWEVWQGGGMSPWLLGGLFGLSGGVRPSTWLVMGPLWLATLCRRPRREAMLAGLAFAAGAALWLVPTVALSGGWTVYHTISRNLSAGLFLPETLLGGDWTAPWRHVLHLAKVLAAGCGPAVLALPVAAWLWLSRRAPADRFMALWAGGGVFYVLVFHFGQDGYLLAFLPPLGYGLVEAWQWLLLRRAAEPRRAALALALGVALLVNNTAVFLARDQARLQAASDAWARRIGIVRRHFIPDETLLFDFGTFHEASWYLKEYRTGICTLLARPTDSIPLAAQGFFVSEHQDVEPKRWWYPSGYRGEPLKLPDRLRYLVCTNGFLESCYQGREPLRRIPETSPAVWWLPVPPGSQLHCGYLAWWLEPADPGRP